MAQLDWPRVLSLAAHELRSPSVVISGYARMLRDGRLDETNRTEALAQIERAAARLSRLGRDTADLARWIVPFEGQHRSADIVALTDRATQTLTAPRVVSVAPLSGSGRVTVLDEDALASAIGVIIEDVAREALDDHVTVFWRAGSSSATFECVVGPTRASGDLPGWPSVDGGVPLDTSRGGLGLGLVLAQAVFDAHGARVSTYAGAPRGVVVALRSAP